MAGDGLCFSHSNPAHPSQVLDTVYSNIDTTKDLMHPFDLPNADVILRSSDKEPVDFRVYKLLLSLASPFFSELFNLPQTSAPSASDEFQDPCGLPIIQMTEDRETLRLLLSLCFPVSISKLPHFSSLQEIQKVIEAACKLEMEGLQRYLRTELIALRFIEAQPLRVFAIAYRYGWDREARMAARYSLRHHMNPAFFLELGYISGATYYRLQEYHRMCGEVASSRVTLQPALAEHDDGWIVKAIHPAGCDALHNISTRPNIICAANCARVSSQGNKFNV